MKCIVYYGRNKNPCQLGRGSPRSIGIEWTSGPTYASTALRIATALSTLPVACSSRRATLIDSTHSAVELGAAAVTVPFEAPRRVALTFDLDFTR
jgi:hypothetical protein